MTYGLTEYDAAAGRTLLVRLPHLSRFAFIGRSSSARAVDRLTSAVAAAMSGAAIDWNNSISRASAAYSPKPRQNGVGAMATARLGKQSYAISEHRAQRFLEMLDAIPGFRRELENWDPEVIRQMVIPGGKVASDLDREFSDAIRDYAREIDYNQVNWLRCALAVYLAESEVAGGS